MLETIWGVKTHAVMDVWTIEHLLSGLSIGFIVIRNNYKVFKKRIGLQKHHIKTKHFDIIAVAFLAYFWETIEHYLETGMAGEHVEYWFQGIEFWPNRIIFDPLMLVLGYLIAKKYPKLVTPARVLSLLWLVFHVIIFPHSMYLHEIL
ncbi:MAG: hypothetical protein HQ538_06510 [Parcubacteria group bacterium]|nr:hypothetical protein [Parcubacteria group bacterium]